MQFNLLAYAIRDVFNISFDFFYAMIRKCLLLSIQLFIILITSVLWLTALGCVNTRLECLCHYVVAPNAIIHINIYSDLQRKYMN